MTNRTDTTSPAAEKSSPAPAADTCYQAKLPCQICGGRLIAIRAKLQCEPLEVTAPQRAAWIILTQHRSTHFDR